MRLHSPTGYKDLQHGEEIHLGLLFRPCLHLHLERALRRASHHQSAHFSDLNSEFRTGTLGRWQAGVSPTSLSAACCLSLSWFAKACMLRMVPETYCKTPSLYTCLQLKSSLPLYLLRNLLCIQDYPSQEMTWIDCAWLLSSAVPAGPTASRCFAAKLRQQCHLCNLSLGHAACRSMQQTRRAASGKSHVLSVSQKRLNPNPSKTRTS